MVWGAIAYGKKWDLVKVDRVGKQGLTAQRYANEIIWPHLSLHIAEMTREGREAVVVEDGASIHHAPIPRAMKAGCGIVNLPHPACSPDLNPIENMWRIIKIMIRRGGRLATSKEALWEQVKKAWDDIPIETVNSLVMSMPERRRECKKNKGRSTKF